MQLGRGRLRTVVTALVVTVVAVVVGLVVIESPRAEAQSGVGYTAYVATSGTGTTISQAYSLTGTPEGTITGPAGDVALNDASVAVGPNAQRVYAVDPNSDGGVMTAASVTPPSYHPGSSTPSTTLGQPELQGNLAGTAVSPDGKFVYMANTGGLFKDSTTNPASSLKIPFPNNNFGPESIALSTNGSVAFIGGSVFTDSEESIPTILVVPTSGSGQIFTIAGQSSTSSNPAISAMAVSADGSVLWAADAGNNTVYKIALPISGNASLAAPSMTVTQVPSALAISPDGTTVYLGESLGTSTTLAKINAATLTSSSSALPLSTPATITGIAVSPDGATLAVTANLLRLTTGTLFLGSAQGSASSLVEHDGPKGSRFDDVAITPDQAPIAHIVGPTSVVANSGPVTFDAASSTVAFGTISYHWNWSGGACTPSGPQLTCTFSVAQPVTITVIETSSGGTSTVGALAPGTNGVDFTGQTASRVANNSAQTNTTLVVTPAPTTSTTLTPPTTSSSSNTAPPTTTQSSSSSSSTIPTVQTSGHPKLTVNPGIGPPGFVTQVNGTGFPPDTALTVTWSVGIGAAPVTTDAAGTFSVPMLVMPNDMPGNRLAKVATFPGVTAPFLVVPGSLQPGGDSNSIVFRR